MSTQPDTTNPRRLEIVRYFNAPRELVFQAWTDPVHLNQWSAPKGMTIPYANSDVRPGGKWTCHMLAPNGELHKAAGVYQEIVAPERLSFTHGWEEDDGSISQHTLVTVILEAEGSRTKMTFTQGEFTSVESRDGHRQGWTECFEILDGVLAAEPMVHITRWFEAPRDRVFAAWADRASLERWYAPKGCQVRFERFEFKTGGAFHSCIVIPGGHKCWCVGEFEEVTAPERIVYTMAVSNAEGERLNASDVGMDPSWPAETRLTVTFQEVNGRTLLTLDQTVSEELAKRTGAHPSWLQMLDNLAGELAA